MCTVCVFSLSTCTTEVFLRTSLQLKSDVCLASETPLAASLENEDQTSGMDDLGYNIIRTHTHNPETKCLLWYPIYSNGPHIGIGFACNAWVESMHCCKPV